MNGELMQVLASVDALREAWEVSLAQASAEEFAETRRRSLRRHAIETGIIERLYDVDWGVTEALVAEGLGSWWTRLQLVVLGRTLRFVVAIQRVGHGESGVLAVTVFAEVLASRASEDEDRPLPTPLLRSTPTDSVTLVFSDDPDARWREVCELIDNTLAAALDKFAQQLG